MTAISFQATVLTISILSLVSAHATSYIPLWLYMIPKVVAPGARCQVPDAKWSRQEGAATGVFPKRAPFHRASRRSSCQRPQISTTTPLQHHRQSPVSLQPAVSPCSSAASIVCTRLHQHESHPPFRTHHVFGTPPLGHHVSIPQARTMPPYPPHACLPLMCVTNNAPGA